MLHEESTLVFQQQGIIYSPESWIRHREERNIHIKAMITQPIILDPAFMDFHEITEQVEEILSSTRQVPLREVELRLIQIGKVRRLPLY